MRYLVIQRKGLAKAGKGSDNGVHLEDEEVQKEIWKKHSFEFYKVYGSLNFIFLSF